MHRRAALGIHRLHRESEDPYLHRRAAEHPGAAEAHAIRQQPAGERPCIRPGATGGRQRLAISRVLHAVEQRGGCDRDHGAVTQTEIDGLFVVRAAAAARLGIRGEGELHRRARRAFEAWLRSVVVVVCAVVRRADDAGGERSIARREWKAHAIVTGSIAEAEDVSAIVIRLRRHHDSPGGGIEQLHLHAAEAEFTAGRLIDAVVVEVVPHHITDGETGGEAKVHGELGVRICVTIIDGLRAGLQRQNRAVDQRSRTAGLATVVVIVHAVVVEIGSAGGQGQSTGRRGGDEVFAIGQRAEDVAAGTGRGDARHRFKIRISARAADLTIRTRVIEPQHHAAHARLAHFFETVGVDVIPDGVTQAETLADGWKSLEQQAVLEAEGVVAIHTERTTVRRDAITAVIDVPARVVDVRSHMAVVAQHVHHRDVVRDR